MGRRRRTESEISEAVSIGARLREAREAARLSQAELGLKMGGRSQQTINDYEAGKTSIPLSILLRICPELDVGLEWFIEGLDPGLYSGFKGDQTRRRGRALFEGLRSILLSEIRRVKKDAGLPSDIKKAYELAAERLRFVRHDDLIQHSFIVFTWDLLRLLAVLRDKGTRSTRGGAQGAQGRRVSKKISSGGGRGSVL